jgi:hypothetical protein
LLGSLSLFQCRQLLLPGQEQVEALKVVALGLMLA